MGIFFFQTFKLTQSMKYLLQLNYRGKPLISLYFLGGKSWMGTAKVRQMKTQSVYNLESDYLSFLCSKIKIQSFFALEIESVL